MDFSRWDIAKGVIFHIARAGMVIGPVLILLKLVGLLNVHWGWVLLPLAPAFAIFVWVGGVVLLMLLWGRER